MDKIRMEHDGVYNNRVIGLYREKYIVYFDKAQGFMIGSPYSRKPTIKELKELKQQFGDLEKEINK